MDRSTSPYWSQFFSQLNLSPEWVEYYSQSFSGNSMQLEMIPDLQPDFMSYLGIHKLGHLIMIKNLADELLSRLSPLPPSIPSYPSSDFESCHSNIASVNTNLSPTLNSEVILDPHEFEAILPSNSLDVTSSIPIEPTPDTELQLLPLFSTPNTSRNAATTTRDGLTSKVKAANKRSRTKRQTLTSITNELQSNPSISISNTPHDSLTNISDVLDHTPSHSPDISSPGVFVFHTKTTRPVISRFHPSGTNTQLRSEIDEYSSPVKSGLVLSANKIDNSQITPVRNQLTNIMSSPLNSQVHNPTDFIPVLHPSQDTSITITSTNLDNVVVPDIRPAELSSPSPATRLNSIQQPTNYPCVTAMSPVHNTSKRKKKPATTKRKTSKRLRPKSPIVVQQFDPWLFDELLPPPLSPQTEELAVSKQSDISSSNTLRVHDSEAAIVTTADSILDTRPRIISVSLTELNSYEQHPISGTVQRDLSENTQGYLAKFATELGELPNFFDQEKIKPSPQKKTRLRKRNKTKTQDVKLSPSKSRKLHNKKTRIVRTNKLIRPTKMKTKVTLKKKQLIRQMTNLSFDTGRRSTSPENSETDLDRRIEHSLSIVKKKYHNFYATIYPELQSQDSVIQLPTQRQRDYATPSQGVQMSLKDTLIHARQERRNFACHKCLLCFETPYQLLQHSMLQSCDEITSSYPEY